MARRWVVLVEFNKGIPAGSIIESDQPAAEILPYLEEEAPKVLEVATPKGKKAV